MIFVYLVPSGFFVFEFLVMLFIGAGVIDNALDPQTIVTIHCAAWATAAASLSTAIYIWISLRKNPHQITGEFSTKVFVVHLIVSVVIFIAASLGLGGAKGGVVGEVFWFLELCIYVILVSLYSAVVCGIAAVILFLTSYARRLKRKPDKKIDQPKKDHPIKSAVPSRKEPHAESAVQPKKAGTKVIPLSDLIDSSKDKT